MPMRIEAPPVLPSRFGLFSVAEMRPSTDPHTFLGVNWTSAGCGPVGAIETCAPEDALLPSSKNLEDAAITVGEADPFAVYGKALCSPIGFSLEDAKQLANEHLVNGEESAVESVLRLRHLQAAGTPVPEAAADLELAVATLEQRIGTEYGSLGVIHADRFTASLLASRDIARPDGAVLRTHLGTPVVAGTGYEVFSDTAPTLFGTGQVAVIRGDVFLGSGDTYGGFDRTVNDLLVLAEREYVLAVNLCGGVLSVTVGG